MVHFISESSCASFASFKVNAYKECYILLWIMINEKELKVKLPFRNMDQGMFPGLLNEP